MTTIKIQPVDEADRAALWCQYPGQGGPQPVYVEFDPETRELHADWNGEIGNAVPESVWHGRILRWYGLPPGAPPAKVNAFLQQLADGGLLDQIADGYECEWDGSNHVGRYSEDAKQACDAVGRMVEDSGIESSVWYAADWLENDVHEIMDEIGSDGLDAAKKRIEDCAEDEGILLISLDDYLDDLARQVDEQTPTIVIIRRRFKSLAAAQGESIDQVCLRNGEPNGRVSLYSRGGSPNVATIAKWAEWLGTTTSYLLGEIDDPVRPPEARPFRRPEKKR